MRLSAASALFAAFAFGQPNVASAQKPPQAKTPPLKLYDNWTDLPDLLGQIVKDRQVPALCLAAFQDGKLVLSGVAGVRKVGKPDPVKVSDRWLIGSVTKSMTATMIGALVERGKLRWDETLADAIPGFPMRDEYRSVTIDQVLHHRSGLVQDQTVDGNQLKRILNGATDPRKIRDNYATDILNRPRIGKPGEKFAYSNAGYSLLGFIAERTMGRPYEDLMQEFVFRPIGVGSGVVGVPGTDGQPGGIDAPHGHYWSPAGLMPGQLEPEFCHMVAPAGLGVSCAIEDLARFAQFHLNGLLGHDGYLKSSTILHLHADAGKDKRPPYACGWMARTDLVPEEAQWHNGSDGTFMAEMIVCPKSGIVIVAIANAGVEGAITPPMQAIQAVYARLTHRGKS